MASPESGLARSCLANSSLVDKPLRASWPRQAMRRPRPGRRISTEGSVAADNADAPHGPASCGRSRRASSLSQPSPSRTASSKEFLPRATLSQPSGRTSFAIMSDRLQQMLAERPFLLADGATGTNLFAAGLMTGEAPELWNFEHPERVEALHQSMVDAGADIILTNS